MVSAMLHDPRVRKVSFTGSTDVGRLLFGGVKQSGLGRGGGHEGMLEYVKSKYIAVSW